MSMIWFKFPQIYELMARNSRRAQMRHSEHCEDGKNRVETQKTDSIPGGRSVAQSGSASGLGPEGRRFESYRSDQFLL